MVEEEEEIICLINLKYFEVGDLVLWVKAW